MPDNIALIIGYFAAWQAGVAAAACIDTFPAQLYKRAHARAFGPARVWLCNVAISRINEDGQTLLLIKRQYQEGPHTAVLKNEAHLSTL